MKIFFPRLGLALLLASAGFRSSALAAGHHVLFVSQAKAAPEIVAADAKAQEHLRALGYVVTFADQRDPLNVAGQDVVVISSGVSAHVVEGKFKSVPVPVVTWEAYILPHMGLTGKKEETDFGTKEGKNRYLWMVNAPQALSAGLPAGLLNVVQKGGPMNWGRPGPGAIVIATLPGELGKSPLFAYERGATMDGENLAPARRVMLFLDNTTFPLLNDAGLKLFDAAVQWAAEGK
ncbi:MAG: hypothetical protein JSR48_05680 [Verrucomicrobia bacterium]|nr:hypothetical protein [Verrucomicrobiota bacterium]